MVGTATFDKEWVISDGRSRSFIFKLHVALQGRGLSFDIQTIVKSAGRSFGFYIENMRQCKTFLLFATC